MSIIALQLVKDALRQTQADDDALLQRLLDSAEDECRRFLGVDDLAPLVQPTVLSSSSSSSSSSEDVVAYAPAVVNGIILMVQADYDGDIREREQYRTAAESLWMPYAVTDRTAT
jgi:hypothetical protein